MSQGSPLSYSNNPSAPPSPTGHPGPPNLTSDGLDQNSYFLNQAQAAALQQDFEQFTMVSSTSGFRFHRVLHGARETVAWQRSNDAFGFPVSIASFDFEYRVGSRDLNASARESHCVPRPRLFRCNADDSRCGTNLDEHARRVPLTHHSRFSFWFKLSTEFGKPLCSSPCKGIPWIPGCQVN